MAIRFCCRGCGKAYTVKDEMAGKRAKCRKCGITLIVPAPDTDDLSAMPQQEAASVEDTGEEVVQPEKPKRKPKASPPPVVVSLPHQEPAPAQPLRDPLEPSRAAEQAGRWAGRAFIAFGLLFASVIAMWIETAIARKFAAPGPSGQVRFPEWAIQVLGLLKIAGMLCGVAWIGLSLVAFVFGVLGLRSVRRSGWRRYGLVSSVCGIAAGLLPVAVALLALPAYARSREKGRRVMCMSNLNQIGRACIIYQEDYGDFFPYDARGPLYSLSLLYPRYAPDPKLFVCPSAKDDKTGRFPDGTSLAGYPCSYGYDHLIHYRDATPSTAVLADMPGNHKGGYNVLYFYGRVEWASTAYASDNPEDNIFAGEPGWGADTDAHIRQ